MNDVKKSAMLSLLLGRPSGPGDRSAFTGGGGSLGFFLVMIAYGVLVGVVIAEPWNRAAASVEAIGIDETKVPTGAARPEELVRIARTRLQAEVTLLGPNFRHKTTWARLGAAVDMKSLGEILRHLGEEDSPSARYYRDEADGEGIPQIALPVALSSDAAVESLVALKEILDQPPLDARFDFQTGKVLPERNGLALDIYKTLHRLDIALQTGAGEVQMAVESVNAAVTRQQLKEIRVSGVMGFFETPYSRMSKDKDRTYNVKLGASRIDGQIILPGETFSFNDFLGERSEAKGFRYAPVIAGGVLVEGMGGGTCQVASTLYAASFFAGLVIEERHTHSRPSSYIKLGLDSTVSYPDLDLKLRNPFSFPVAIHFLAEEGNLRVEIRGKERSYTVTLLRKVIGTDPFPTRIIEDSNLLKGKTVITQNGIPGYTVRRYQIVESEKVGYRFQTVDRYPPTTQFVRKGTAVSTSEIDPAEVPKPDLHKPYHASTYLRMVQGPDGLWYERSHE